MMITILFIVTIIGCACSEYCFRACATILLIKIMVHVYEIDKRSSSEIRIENSFNTKGDQE